MRKVTDMTLDQLLSAPCSSLKTAIGWDAPGPGLLTLYRLVVRL